MNARHCGDRVVELRDEAPVEVDAADVGDRVDEMVERPRRRGREEEEDRLRAEGCERGSAAQAMEIGMTPAKEPHQPSHGEADVQRHVGDVENGHGLRRGSSAAWRSGST